MDDNLHNDPLTTNNWGRGLFLYLIIVTAISIALIVFNDWLDLGIPFTAHFLVGFVGALLLFVIWHAVITKGWKRSLLMFSVSYLLAFTAEVLGVNFGLVFGRYYYTDVLGVGLFGVPFLAALAWEPILYAAFNLTEILIPTTVTRPGWSKNYLFVLMGVGFSGALATTAWDMMIDPIAVSQRWWVWQDGGAYVPQIENGVPISNYLGWLGVSFLIMLIYRLIIDSVPNRHSSKSLTIHGPITLYASLFLTAFGVSLTILERADVALVGLMAMGPFLSLAITNGYLAIHGLGSSFGAGWLDVAGPE